MEMKIQFNKRFLIIFLMFLYGNMLNAQEKNPEILLYRGVAPGSESWNWNEESTGETGATIYNVTTPSLTVFKPDAKNANGKAVIICPGGAFYFLAIEKEGYAIARWLQEKGFTCFVLKYRLVRCFTNDPGREMMEKKADPEKFNKDIVPIVDMAISDGKVAIAFVRTHAAQWNLSPSQIGIMGFSAGGTVTAGISFKYDRESRPDFAAPIYPYVGSFGNPQVPEDAPPIFIAGASDDSFGFNMHCTRLYNQWTEAGKLAELHIYRKGEHGFGLQKQNLPTDNWIDRFYEWVMNLEQ